MIKQRSSSSVALSHEEKGCPPDLLIISENGKQLALFSLSFVPPFASLISIQSALTRKGTERNPVSYLVLLQECLLDAHSRQKDFLKLINFTNLFLPEFSPGLK